ncbi:hypothetical protein [Methylobacterium goesingense]|uniref:DUF4342 domain-containing protein n=1 Tax=Methylobacterium goesingense TaxID=243690 RepID=A0ABV2L960_9HYPH|nr:hypothetical protein [Methylobacterium goesingense]
MLTADEILIALDCEPSYLADPEVRASIKEVSHQLESAGISPMSHVYARTGTIIASATSLGPYLVPIAQVIIPTLGVILVAWIKSPGRKIKIRVGNMRIEANSVEEIELLLSKLQELQGNPSKAVRKKPIS